MKRLLPLFLLGTLGISGAHAASISLAQIPLFLSTGVNPNVLVILDNSQSMDGTLAGKLIAGDDAATRGNIGRQVIRDTITNYRNSFNWGVMAYAFSGSPARYNTYPYFMGSTTGMVFTADCQPIAPATTVSADTPGVSASNGNRLCVPNPQSFSGGQFVTFDTSSDNPAINDVLYWSGSLSSLWGISTSGTNYAMYSTHNNTNAWTSGNFSGGQGTWSFTPTDAGYTPKNPPVARQLYLPRAWGYLNYPTGVGDLYEAVMTDSSTHFSNLTTRLASETGTSSSEIKNASVFTPLPGTLQSAFNYFRAGMRDHGGTTRSSPIQYTCQQNFVMLVTDGLPTGQTNGNQYTYNNDLNANGNPIGYGSQPTSDTVSAIQCLLGGVTNSFCSVAGVKPSGLTGPGPGGIFPIQTYVVALGDTLANADAVTDMNLMAAAGDPETDPTRKRQAYLAYQQSELESAIHNIVQDIVLRIASASAISLNRGTWNSTSALYQARFNSGDWSGQLLSYRVNSDGSLASQASWDSGQVLNGQNWSTGRAILTYKPSASAGQHGIPFRWPADPASPGATELDSTQTSVLNRNGTGATDNQGALRLAWLRGSRTNEAVLCGGCTPEFRTRPTSILGDIVDSSPYYVGAPPFNYPASFAPTSYASYYASKKTRPAMIYVGANDGMLHGFDAATGRERLAYLPSKLYSTTRLSQLPEQNYSHRYFVDGTPTMGDAWLTSDSAWHTLLVGGLAAGGQGLYALDVSDPASFSEETVEARKVVRWEFNDSDDTGDADTTADATLRYALGYTYSQPLLVKTNLADSAGHTRNRWAVIFGNGYNNTESDGAASTSGYAVLYILDAETGAVIRKLNTRSGSTTTPNGLASPTAVDTDGNGTVDIVYAGDLSGKLWKFDLSSSDASQWKPAFGTTGSPLPFIGNNRSGQAITTSLEVARAAGGAGYMVYFGTGKYLESSDISTTAIQSFYGILDPNDGVKRYTLGTGTDLGANLLHQTIDDTVTVSSGGASMAYRVTSAASTISGGSQNAANRIATAGSFLGAFSGWYMDFPNSPAAERQVTEPVLSGGKIIFTTMMPNSDPCNYGGNGWVMEMDAGTGNRPALSFDVDQDGRLTTADTVSSVDGTVAPSGRRLEGIGTSPGILGGDARLHRGTENKYMSLSTGEIRRVMESSTTRSGRVSWQQVQ
jgi:type IV pilus assembly protein PilY1